MVIIYTKRYCVFCVLAKQFFESNFVAYKEIDISNNIEKLNQLKSETGFMTLPQIFVGGKFVGGFTEMMEKINSGELKLPASAS